MVLFVFFAFFFQAEDGIRDLVRSRGLGDVYKRQVKNTKPKNANIFFISKGCGLEKWMKVNLVACLFLSLIHI